MCYSFQLASKVLLYVSSHRQDNTYHSLCYTSRGALVGMWNSSMGPPLRIDLTIHHTMNERFYHRATSLSFRRWSPARCRILIKLRIVDFIIVWHCWTWMFNIFTATTFMLTLTTSLSLPNWMLALFGQGFWISQNTSIQMKGVYIMLACML